MLGTSEAWSASHLSQRISIPAYYIVDCWISELLGFPQLAWYWKPCVKNWKYPHNTHLELTSSQYESARAKSRNLVKWWHFLLTLKTTKGWNFCCRLHMQCATIFRDDNIAPATGIIHCTLGLRVVSSSF